MSRSRGRSCVRLRLLCDANRAWFLRPWAVIHRWWYHRGFVNER